MRRKPFWIALAGTLALAGGAFLAWGREIEFVLGGAMVNLGYRLQDPIESFDFVHPHATAEEVWNEFLHQNRMAASVRDVFPRTSRHPLVAMVTCMDARLDTAEIAGDTRRYYYVLRLAGSVLSPKEEEMLELAVANGTKVVIFTTHTDCAAEKMAADPEQRKLYPELVTALQERKARREEFLRRPAISERIAKGEILVKRMKLDTASDRLVLPDE